MTNNFGACSAQEVLRLSTPKHLMIGGRSHAVGRPSRPSSALPRSSHDAANAAIQQLPTARPNSGSATPVKSGAVTPNNAGGVVRKGNGSSAQAVVDALGRLSPQEVDRLQRVLQQGNAQQ